MYRYGHVGAALAFYAPLGFVLAAVGRVDLAIVGGAGAGALAMLPDYDQRVPGIAHRGPTHTAWFAVLVGVVLGVLAGIAGSSAGALPAVTYAVVAFLVGVLTIGSHIAADSLTPMGVTPFTPVSAERYTYDLVRAANPIANYALLVLGGAVALGALAAGHWLHGHLP